MPQLLLPYIDEANPDWVHDADNQLSPQYWDPKFDPKVKQSPSDEYVLKLRKNREGFADFMQAPSGPSALIISGRMKSLIELFEPNIHFYWRTRVRDADDNGLHADLYAFRPGNMPEALVVDQSDARMGRFPGLIHPIGLTPSLMWDAGAVKGMHVWCDARMAGHYVFSDSLFAEIVSRDFSGYVAKESRLL